MQYLVIWFVMTSMVGTEQMTNVRYHTHIEVKEAPKYYSVIYRNYEIVDNFEEAEKIAKIRKSADTKVFIYELGKQYEVERQSYKVKELQEITKYKNLIKEVE